MESIQIPLGMGVIMLIMPLPFFGAVTFFGPAQSPFYHPRLASFLDSRYGARSYESFLVRLKPSLLFGVLSVLQGSVALWQSGFPYFIAGFFISGGIAFMAAHAILHSRKAIGVYAAPNSE
jgi:hypothetical protein